MRKLKKQSDPARNDDYEIEIESFAECELPVLLDEIGAPAEVTLERFKDLADYGIDWGEMGVIRSNVWSFTFEHQRFRLFRDLQGHTPVEIAWLIYRTTEVHTTLRMNFIKRALNL